MMNSRLRNDADKIVQEAVASVLPDKAVKKALHDIHFQSGKIILAAVGKAAWQMADAAVKALGTVDEGIVITKYGHIKGEIPGVHCYEAGHPVPDQNGFAATKEMEKMVTGLQSRDNVLFLLSGGGSALFEDPKIPAEELQQITSELLASGADIQEINTVRKHLSNVKGGRFAEKCLPAHVYAVILSDIIGSPLDAIASGPACPDPTTAADALKVIEKYHLSVSKRALQCLRDETPKYLSNVTSFVTGSVSELCHNTKDICEKLGYHTVLLTDHMDCEAREAGTFLADIACTWQKTKEKTAFIAGGETVVHLQGTGKGGRNQEITLSAGIKISGLKNTAVFSLGSDGTDGPTDAAGGYADGDTILTLQKKAIDAEKMLDNNDAYHALQASDGLIITGPTGTNVNDVSVVLIDPIE